MTSGLEDIYFHLYIIYTYIKPHFSIDNNTTTKPVVSFLQCFTELASSEVSTCANTAWSLSHSNIFSLEDWRGWVHPQLDRKTHRKTHRKTLGT